MWVDWSTLFPLNGAGRGGGGKLFFLNPDFLSGGSFLSSKNRSNSSMCTANVYRILFILVCHQGISSYRGTPLIRSPIGQKKLALLTGARIEKDFFTTKCTAVLPGGQ